MKSQSPSPRRATPLLALGLLCGFAANAGAVERTFVNPEIRDMPVDYCGSWSGECGEPAADQFCRAMHFRRAERFELHPSQAMPAAAHLWDPTRDCLNGLCRTFSAITCAAPSSAVLRSRWEDIETGSSGGGDGGGGGDDNGGGRGDAAAGGPN